MKWISVKEALPEDYWEPYATYSRQFAHISYQQNIYNGIAVGTAAYDRNKGVWFSGGLTEELGYCVIPDVTHWMPLPEPPKPESKKSEVKPPQSSGFSSHTENGKNYLSNL